MGHWDAIYRDRSLGRVTTSSGGGVGNVKRQTRTNELRFEARFTCPSCDNFMAPGVLCDACDVWAVDSTSRLHLLADTDSMGARFSRWREERAARVRRATGVVHATIVAVSEDSTPSDPEHLVAAYVSREDGSYHSVCGSFAVEVAAGDPYRTARARFAVTRAKLVAPSLARGERRELVMGGDVILTGLHQDEMFFGDVWLERE